MMFQTRVRDEAFPASAHHWISSQILECPQAFEVDRAP
jgi:hypothetical protein